MKKFAGVLCLMCACWSAAGQGLTAQAGVSALLERLGLQGVFTSLQPLVAAQLQLAGDAIGPAVRASARQALAADALQRQLETLLRADFEPQLYASALELLQSPSLDPLIASCNDGGVRDYRAELESYQARMEERPPLESRVSLAVQLDAASRSSRIAASAQGRLERIIAGLATGAAEAAVPWEEIDAERLAALQRGARTWYLYCARFAPDARLQRLVERYYSGPVQQVLDRYETALSLTLESAGVQLGQRAAGG